MTTPAFITQDSTFTPIQYFTALDPYYYVVDNRPITNVETNIHNTNLGVDAARRAILLESIAAAVSRKDSYTNNQYTTGFSGLPVTQVSSSSVQIGPGALYDTRPVNTAFSEQIVKTAVLTNSPIFNITAPITAGQSVIYTIEGVFLDINDTTMATSALPYVDQTNTFLPSNILAGELQLYLNATGIPATTGTQVAPTTTPGNYPLYNITMTQGSSTYTVTMHPNAPLYKGIKKAIIPIVPTSSGATMTISNNIPLYACPKSGTAGLLLPISIPESNMNPYAPITFIVTFSPTVTGGNAAFQVNYSGLTPGSAISTGATASGIEVVPVTAAAGGVQTFTTSTAVVPNTAFANFSSGLWTVNVEFLSLLFNRLPTNAADTNTGTINILSVVATQSI